MADVKADQLADLEKDQTADAASAQIAQEDAIRARGRSVQRELMARPDVRRAAVALGVLAVLKAAGLIGLMSALAHVVATFARQEILDVTPTLLIAACAIAAQAVSAFASPIVARRASTTVAQDLRTRVLQRRLNSGRVSEPQSNAANVEGSETSELPRSEGAEIALATRGVDALDKYFTDYVPAFVFALIVPAFVGAWILIQDWVSALIIALTIPLVPLFMILIGRHTAQRVAESAEGLARLSHHLIELARGLPVLVGIRRADTQRAALEDVSRQYRKTTMGTLRAAFTSSFALELIATISVAIVAVFIGVRLVHGQMTLEAGLVALMLAPECFAAFRNVGAAFHASEDGAEAYARATSLADRPIANRYPTVGEQGTMPSGVVVRVKNLRIRYAQRSALAVGPVSFEVRAGESLALWGGSGSGKSSILHVLAGLIRADGETDLAGDVEMGNAHVHFAGQSPRFAFTRVREELEFYAQRSLTTPEMTTALRRAALVIDPEQAISELSPGEQRRVAIARLLVLHNQQGKPAMYLLDEPTAHLDKKSAHIIRELVVELASQGTVVAATHDAQLATALGAQFNVANGEFIALHAAELPASEVTAVDIPNQPAQQHYEPATEKGDATPKFPWRSLMSTRFLLGSLYGALAVLAAAALSAVSGWLIVYASQQPPVMYLLVAIVGVRFFGLSRSVLKYLERLAIHDEILRWSANLRVKLWDALANNIVNWKRLTHSGAAAERLIGDVDELRDVLPRAVTPVASAAIAALAMLIAVGVLTPSALPAVIGFVVLGFMVLPLVVYRSEKNSTAQVTAFRTQLMGRYAAIQSATPEISANGLERPATAYVAGDPDRDYQNQRTAARADGVTQAGVVVLSGLFALVTALLCATANVDPRLAALSTLVVLALAEPLQLAVDAIRHWPTVQSVWSRTAPLLADSARTVVAESATAERPRVDGLTVNRLSARYPGMNHSVFAPVSATLAPGEWWTVTGPSGSGKSTLIAVLLGFLKYDGGRYLLQSNGTWGEPYAGDASGLTSLAWCPQEAHVFDSTLAGNLALARERDDAPTEDEMTSALERVGLGPWLAELPAGLRTRTGAQGNQLSGGQRQRLAVARALLAHSSVVILDEPTAHLGHNEGHQMIANLRELDENQLWIMVTHDESLAAAGDKRSVLGAPVAERVSAS
ncbi:thiol reductant ABC exporter subunit CydC [Neomicrococcus lactis]|uniref:ATP-binding cassette subfamily C protein CydCD n=1 Tax=Neomicrococcus lactis TaxID=732241 RepID=A0A7W8Y994_9MICC|nr:ATP-binding cassette subfamily C protein CydCD [Neomicrococcus lactis]